MYAHSNELSFSILQLLIFHVYFTHTQILRAIVDLYIHMTFVKINILCTSTMKSTTVD